MKYKQPLFNQNQLGKLFAISSHEIGHWLVGWRMRVREPIDEILGVPR